MLSISGKYATAIAYLDELEKSALGQLKAICDLELAKGCAIRVMPDAHAGVGCVIGTTMTIADKVTPNFVGVDIGCGMETINLGDCRMDFAKLDKVIRERVPCGTKERKTPHRFAQDIGLEKLSAPKIIPEKKAVHAIGTLGGGNHFIEIDVDEASGDHFLIIHSGSRNAGLQVATHHQKLAGQRELEGVPYPLAYLEGKQFEDYLNDMKIMQAYAALNRAAMADEIMKAMKWKAKDAFTTVHNCIDTDAMILRKGAVSAKKGERLLIPLNMRDGALICEGLGNPEWNSSAPHGAGRRLSRTEARASLTLTEFKRQMEGVYSTCVRPSTLDESPMAYKPAEEIVSRIGETVNIVARLTPVYNFKAGS